MHMRVAGHIRDAKHDAVDLRGWVGKGKGRAEAAQDSSNAGNYSIISIGQIRTFPTRLIPVFYELLRFGRNRDGPVELALNWASNGFTEKTLFQVRQTVAAVASLDGAHPRHWRMQKLPRVSWPERRRKMGPGMAFCLPFAYLPANGCGALVRIS